MGACRHFSFIHVVFIPLLCLSSLYVMFHFSCPHLQSFSPIDIPDTPSLIPPASLHPCLDGLYSLLLASNRSRWLFLSSAAHFPVKNRYRSSFLIYLCLLLCGDIELNPGPNQSTRFSLGTLNIRSATTVTPDLDKPTVLHDFILDNSLEILTLTETWLSPDTPSLTLNSLTPPNFHLIHKPRLTGRGGGLAVIYRSYLKIKELSIPSYSSFESLCFNLTLPSKSLSFLTVYRPPSSSLSSFCTEFSNLLADLCSQPSDLLILGDFNIHLDNPSLQGTNSFLNIIDSFDLKQHVNFPTHESGHTLDLLISRSSSSLINNIYPSFPALSDHDAVLATLSVSVKDRPARMTKTIRPIRSIDPVSFSNDILSSDLYKATPATLSEYLHVFISTLTSLLNKHAPSRTITCSASPSKPFITPEIRAAKAKRSKLESIYRKNKTPINLANFKSQAKIVSCLISSARRKYFHSLVTNSAGKPRQLWTTLNKLLNRSTDPKLPFSFPITSLPSAFLHFFSDKISKLRATLQSNQSSPHIPPPVPPPVLTAFVLATEEEIRKIILSASDATCLLDVLPTRLLKSCNGALLPPITTLLNLCLTESTFPTCFKNALVTPLLKKSTLPQDDLFSYRPISNLSFLSKILERLIFNRLLVHLNSFDSISPF